jgi:hypothetical protein
MASFLLWIEKSLLWAETLQGYQCPPRYSPTDKSIVRARKAPERRRDTSSHFVTDTIGGGAQAGVWK